MLRILFHCCERDIFQEGQFWLYPVLIPIHDGGTRVIKLIRLGYVLWNWASTLQIFCLIHYWTFHRILINSSNQLRKKGLDAVKNYRCYILDWSEIPGLNPICHWYQLLKNAFTSTFRGIFINPYNQLRFKWGLLFYFELDRNPWLPFITLFPYIPYYVCLHCPLPLF